MPKTETYSNLIQRLDCAEWPSRTIFHAVARAVLPLTERDTHDKLWQFMGVGAWSDAALLLVERTLPGWQWLVRNDLDGRAFASLHPIESEPNEGGVCFSARAANPCFALLSVLLQVLVDRETGGASHVQQD